MSNRYKTVLKDLAIKGLMQERYQNSPRLQKEIREHLTAISKSGLAYGKALKHNLKDARKVYFNESKDRIVYRQHPDDPNIMEILSINVRANKKVYCEAGKEIKYDELARFYERRKKE